MEVKAELYEVIEKAAIKLWGDGAPKTHSHIIERMYTDVSEYLERGELAILATQRAK